MPSTFSSNLRVELMADGERSTTWGQITNTNLELLEAAISEMATIATTGGTTVLTALNGADDQARKAVLKITGTLVSNATIQIPAVTKWYLVWNATSGAYTVTIKTASGTGQTVTANQVRLVYCDGTDVFNLVANTAVNVSGGTVGGTASGLGYDLASNTMTGTLAQFNTALSDGDFATLAGAETLTGKTINLANNTLTGTTAQFNAALSDGDFLTTAGATMTGLLISRGSVGGMANASAGTPGIEVIGAGAGSDGAYMRFHRPGAFAAFLGLDTDNKVKVGGYSMGAVAYELAHAGNALGLGQTWQDVKASRAANTTYTNTSGRTIMVLISCSSVLNTTINFTLNGTPFQWLASGPTYGVAGTICIPVPPGGTYSNTFGSATSQITWWELR